MGNEKKRSVTAAYLQSDQAINFHVYAQHPLEIKYSIWVSTNAIAPPVITEKGSLKKISCITMSDYSPLPST